MSRSQSFILMLRKTPRGGGLRARVLLERWSTSPKPREGEVAVRLEVSVNGAVFERPVLCAKLEVDERHVVKGAVEIAQGKNP